MNFRNIILTALLLPVSLMAMSQNYNFDEVSYTPRHTTFKLIAPDDVKHVVLSLYMKGDVATDKKPLATKQMKHVGKNLWSVTVRGDLNGRFYTFNIGKGRDSRCLCQGCRCEWQARCCHQHEAYGSGRVEQ